jgi:hypothetical protein
MEYLEVAKALEARAVILYSEALEESDFLANSAADDDDDDGNGSDTEEDEMFIDLCVVEAKLSRFKDRLGQHGLFCVSIALKDEHLDLALEEPWWREFLDLRDDTVGRLVKDLQERSEAARSRAEDETKSILARLHALVEDGRFVCLPTQKAMLHYALRKFPELKHLSHADLKAEIQELKARIDADVE